MVYLATLSPFYVHVGTEFLTLSRVGISLERQGMVASGIWIRYGLEPFRGEDPWGSTVEDSGP